MPDNKPTTAEDRKNFRIGCGMIVAAFLVIGGCTAAMNDDSSTSSSSSSGYADRPKHDIVLSDYTGMGLQEAQDAAQAAGIINLESTDATGQSRMQVWDRHWTVCSQDPAAGTTISTTDTLTFDTVNSHDGETCDDPTGTGDDSATDDSVTDDTSGTYDSDVMDGTDDSSSDDSSSDDSYTDDSSDDSDSQAPAGASAECNDGTYSFSAHRRGTCSHHGGVSVWLVDLPS